MAEAQPLPAVEAPHIPREPFKASRRKVGPLTLALGAGLLALALLLLFTSRRPSHDPPPPRYLVVEKPPPTPAAGSVSAPAPAAESVSPPALPSAGSAPPSPEKPARAAAVRPVKQPARAQPDAAALSQKFRAKQPQIEACFRREAEQVVGMPRVSVRFEVDRSGKVTQATLSPPALSGTPLGRCLLATAQTARFGALTEPVAFSIPITARRGAAR
jgi:hypothetical protein